MDCRHLRTLTDDTGMIQFTTLDKPDPGSGYTTDDNARALLVALRLDGEERQRYARIYVDFLRHAQRPDGGWYNLKLYRQYVSTLDSEDSLGRAFLACSVAATCDVEDVRCLSRQMALKAMPVVLRVKSPRSMAYTLIGMVNITGAFQQNRDLLIGAIAKFGQALIEFYNRNKNSSWRWFEDKLTYCNGILPHALFAYYSFSGDKKALQVAQDSMRFLGDALFKEGYLNIVGNRGWWLKGHEMPLYDQQPVDACSTALACAEGYRATGHKDFLEMTRLAHNWYWGKNINNIPLYNPETGGCYDALVPGGVNRNQGAEAILSLLLTRQAMMELGLDVGTYEKYREAREAV
ncbi:MAG: hypothetical protein GXX09_02685 [Syntrophomonadaceae bacterium]|nr:hypothetical protein [Syntrophomonadaceae bacterium]